MGGGESLCEKHGVQGYPTIKWGEPTDLKDYEGGRDLESLRKFATENLGPTCGPNNLDLCDETDKKFIAKFMKWDIDELDLAIEEKDEKISKLEAKEKKNCAYNFIKAVKASRTKKEDTTDDDEDPDLALDAESESAKKDEKKEMQPA